MTFALLVWAGKGFEDLEEKDRLLNQSVAKLFIEQPRLHGVW